MCDFARRNFPIPARDPSCPIPPHEDSLVDQNTLFTLIFRWMILTPSFTGYRHGSIHERSAVLGAAEPSPSRLGGPRRAREIGHPVASPPPRLSALHSPFIRPLLKACAALRRGNDRDVAARPTVGRWKHPTGARCLARGRAVMERTLPCPENLPRLPTNR